MYCYCFKSASSKKGAALEHAPLPKRETQVKHGGKKIIPYA